MTGAQRIWLVVNDASGSTDAEAIATLEKGCGSAGLALERIVRFPAQTLPTPAELDGATEPSTRWSTGSPAGAERCWCCPAGR